MFRINCRECGVGYEVRDGDPYPPEGWTRKIGLGRVCPTCSGSQEDSQETPSGHDPVDHPSHYTSHPSGVECIEITQHMTFCLGNAVKYLWRSGLKDSAPAPQDLKKARWYIKQELKRLGAWEEGEE